MKLSLSLFVSLALTWWLLSGYANALLLGLGLVSVGFTVWLARRMAVIDRESHPLHLSLALLRFWAGLLRDIVVSNVQVVRLILSPRLGIDPQVVTVETRQTSELGLVVLANAITLTPGTVTMDIERKHLVVHALTRATADEIRAGIMDARVPANVEDAA